MREHYLHLLNKVISITEVADNVEDNSIIDCLKYVLDYYEIHFPLDTNQDINVLANQATPYLQATNILVILTLLKHNLDTIHPNVFLIVIFKYLFKRHDLPFMNPFTNIVFERFNQRCGAIVVRLVITRSSESRKT
jgi:hypothetical protein